LVYGSGSVVIPDVGFGFGSGFKEKMIEFTDVAETAREDETTKKGSEDKVSGFGRDVVSEFVCTFDISGRFDSNILYDPGGDLWLCCAAGDVKTDKMMTSEVAEEKCGEILDGFGMLVIFLVWYLEMIRCGLRNAEWYWSLKLGGYWYPVFSAFVSLADLCCCCYLESPLSVQDFLDHEQSVFLEFEVSSSLCAATSRMLRSCSTIE
jgi:hypothetical protein